MAKSKIRNINIIFFLGYLISFMLGGLAIYLVITKTSLVSLNYHDKYMQLYTSNKVDESKPYIDLVKGYMFINPNLPEDNISNLSNLIDQYETPFTNQDVSLGDLAFVYVNKVNPKESLMEFAKRTSKGHYNYPSLKGDGLTYSSRTINGHEAVIVTSKITQEMQDSIPQSFYDDHPGVVLLVKPGSIQKSVYIRKNANIIYHIDSGELKENYANTSFDQIVNSFKFIY